MSEHPKITGSRHDYDIPHVDVEPYRVNDRDGRPHEVHGFWSNGPGWHNADGFQVKKDGTRGRVARSISTPVPAHVKAALGVEERKVWPDRKPAFGQQY